MRFNWNRFFKRVIRGAIALLKFVVTCVAENIAFA